MSGTRFTVFIVGGYGTFGGRLVDLLADEPRLRLVIAGRSLEAAQAFCRRSSAAHLVAARFDRNGDVAAQLRTVGADLVIDASGPFQNYGSDPYRVVRAAIEAGASYLDLADAAGFVGGIAELDALAKQHGRFALSGMSSFPVLTAAVVRRLADGMTTVESITGGIAPSPFAGVGRNVVEAIASYAGKPIAIREAGRPAVGYGFVDSRYLVVNVPGRVPLPRTWFGLVEVPDLEVLAADWPAARSIWMGAGPTPAALHRLLWGMAWLVRLRLLPSLMPFAPVMNVVINTVRWGEHRGGMMVEIEGQGPAGAEIRSWHLLAEGEAGPLIPSMAAEAIVRKCLDGQYPEPGARPGHHDLELADYDRLFAKRGIITGFRRSGARAVSLYETILGDAYARLSQPLQSLHRFGLDGSFQGRARVQRGAGWLSRLAASVFRFPDAAADVLVRVRLTWDARGREVWQRTFAGRSFQSTQEAGTGRNAGLLVERFGPLAFAMAVVEENGRLKLLLRRWSALGVPLPRWVAPRAEVFEHDAGGRFNFCVDIALPLAGRIVRYEGWLEPSR
jgi:hypothetical protein